MIFLSAAPNATIHPRRMCEISLRSFPMSKQPTKPLVALLLTLLASYTLLCETGYAQTRPTDRKILTQADEARGNLQGVRWRLELHSRGSKGNQDMTLDVKARGFDVVIYTLAPARSKGNRLIMLKENMWFDKPGLSKPVPISKRQKLMGNAAYGDVATTNYAEDYTAVLTGEETVNGRPCYVYDLKAKHRKVTYDRIKYWIEKERLVGIQAEYFTVSGKKFKSARMEFHNRVRRGGSSKPFISKLVIQDELVGGSRTTLRFSRPKLETIPDSEFNLSLIAK